MNKTILDINGRFELQGRRSGNTTRMIDAAIQLLFQGNKIIYITNIPMESETFLKRIKNRFYTEHYAGPSVENNVLPHLRQWEGHRSLRRLIILREIGPEVRGITYFDKDNKPQHIDDLHPSKIAFIIELQSKQEYDELKDKAHAGSIRK